MDELNRLIEESLSIDLQQIVLSNTRDEAQGTRLKVRPVLLKGELFFQKTLYKGTQVFHENLVKKDMQQYILYCLEKLFKQGVFVSDRLEATVLVSKKGKVTVKTKNRVPDNARALDGRLSHDRSRQYILPEGVPVDFLVKLGVQTPDGRITKAKYGKFRQINRYLEFIEDVMKELPADRKIRIIDFGCGKSYLTFAMYYYLHKMRNRAVQITGLDLKEDVKDHCNALAEELRYAGDLHFEKGDISTYAGADSVDMVVSLHACDKATDYALDKAVKWGAKVILAVPCCQHELNGQIRCEALQPLLKYGVIRERMAALVTDALRADLLEQQGYETQILEFIDMEHTPKNLLIRAVKRDRTGMKAKSLCGDIQGVTEFLHVTPTLEQLLK